MIDICIFGTTSKLVKNFLSYTDSFATSQAETYWASMVESTIQPFFMLLHIIAPLFRVKTDPDIDFHESISIWKSESVYPVRSDP